MTDVIFNPNSPIKQYIHGLRDESYLWIVFAESLTHTDRVVRVKTGYIIVDSHADVEIEDADDIGCVDDWCMPDDYYYDLTEYYYDLTDYYWLDDESWFRLP